MNLVYYVIRMFSIKIEHYFPVFNLILLKMLHSFNDKLFLRPYSAPLTKKKIPNFNIEDLRLHIIGKLSIGQNE